MNDHITQTTLWVSGCGYCGLCSKLSGGGECLHEVEQLVQVLPQWRDFLVHLHKQNA